MNLSTFKQITRRWCGPLALGALALCMAGCGDTFRPIVTPIPTPGGDPGNQHTEYVLTQTPAAFVGPCLEGAAAPCPGMVMQVNVSGDNNSSGLSAPGDLANYSLSATPIHAALSVNTVQTLWTVNRDSDAVSAVVPSGGTNNTVALPAGSKPVFVAIAADPNPPAGTINDLVLTANAGNNTVSFVDSQAKAVRFTVPVGTNPVAILGLANTKKAYVVNRGSNTVSVLSLIDGSELHTPIALPAGADPVWAVENNTQTAVYVVNHGSNNVSVIDVGLDAVTANAPVGAGPTYAVFDPKRLRVYVTSPGANNVTVIDGSTAIGTASLPAGALNPVSVAALPDGSRFYTANSTTNNVTVFDALSLQPRTTIAVGVNPVWIAAAADSTRVYAANHDSTVVAGVVTQPAGVTVIRTVAGPGTPATAPDTVVTTLPAPFANVDPTVCQSDIGTKNPDGTPKPLPCPRQNPVFILSGT